MRRNADERQHRRRLQATTHSRQPRRLVGQRRPLVNRRNDYKIRRQRLGAQPLLAMNPRPPPRAASRARAATPSQLSSPSLPSCWRLFLRPRAQPGGDPQVRDPAARRRRRRSRDYTRVAAAQGLDHADNADFTGARRRSRAALKDVQTWIKCPLSSAPLTENMRYHRPEPAHTRAAARATPSEHRAGPERLDYGLNSRSASWPSRTAERPTTLDRSPRPVSGLRTRPEYPLLFVDRGDGVLVADLSVPKASPW